MKKRILISAYACEPGRGSEPGVGWNLVRELSSNYKLTVATRLNNKKIINECKEDWIQEVQWIFLDPPRWLTFWKRKGRGVQLFYILWQFYLRRRVRKLKKEQKFDVFHHLTFGKYWVPSGLAGLGVPMVFGPVGGGEATPDLLAESLPRKARMAEGARGILKWMIQHTPGVKSLYSSCDINIAATHQTAEELHRIGLSAVTVLPQSGIGREDFSDVEMGGAALVPKTKSAESLQLVTACRLIYWKGVDLAIRAVGAARKEGLDVSLVVLQDGPEKGALEALVHDLGLVNYVTFLGHLPTLTDVYQTIRHADALIHPAYHEAFGQSCLESLALGVPVVCLDWGGPAVVVDEDTGIKVEPSNYQGTVENLAIAIQQLSSKLGEGALSGKSCVDRAFKEFSWERLANSIGDIYEDVC